VENPPEVDDRDEQSKEVPQARPVSSSDRFLWDRMPSEADPAGDAADGELGVRGPEEQQFGTITLAPKAGNSWSHRPTRQCRLNGEAPAFPFELLHRLDQLPSRLEIGPRRRVVRQGLRDLVGVEERYTGRKQYRSGGRLAGTIRARENNN